MPDYVEKIEKEVEEIVKDGTNKIVLASVVVGTTMYFLGKSKGIRIGYMKGLSEGYASGVFEVAGLVRKLRDIV